MNNLPKIILIFLLFALIAAPLAVLAASPSLVPCGLSTNYPDCVAGKCPDGTTCIAGTADVSCEGHGGINEKTPCSLCHLYILIQRILDFMMFTIAPVVAVLAVGWGGFNILISGEKPGKRAEGFKIIQTTVIGLAIMFAGWVVINETILFFGQKSADNSTIGSVQATSTNGLTKWLPWNEVQCLVPNLE